MMKNQHLPSPLNYREDINGLRAYAVIAVLLFHFSLIGLPGGFVGVDIFFVISGYLMAAIVIGGHLKGNFSLVKFYMARARRILPALMVMIVTLLVLGWFWLPTIDYQALGKQSAYGMAFLSNMHYANSAGYFDIGAHEKWLLHTWSLAVEAQFYLLFPLLIAIIWRFFQKIAVVILVLLCFWLVSFTINLYWSSSSASNAFYLLPSRAWELLSGALVYLFGRNLTLTLRVSALLYWFGWLFVLGSFLFIESALAWPSYWALFPVVGAGLIIFSARTNSVMTSNRIIQWLGDRSYSLYLWHWPIVVGLVFVSLQDNWTWVVSGFLFSLILAHLSYRWIEVPTRSILSAKSFKTELVLIALFALVIAVVSVIVNKYNFTQRMNPTIESIAFEAENFNPRRSECLNKGNCVIGQGDLGAIMWGDSHADAVITSLAAVTQKIEKSTLNMTFNACPAIFGAKSTDWRAGKEQLHCDNNDLLMQQTIANYPNVPVVIVTRTTHYLFGFLPNEQVVNDQQRQPLVYFNRQQKDASDTNLQAEFTQGIIDTACQLQKTHPVFLVRPIPEMGVNVPKTLSRNMLFRGDNTNIKISLSDYHKRHDLVWKAQDKAAQMCGVRILDPIPYLCDAEYCYGSKDGRALYYDDDHLSEYGNRLLEPMFKQVFKDSSITLGN